MPDARGWRFKGSGVFELLRPARALYSASDAGRGLINSVNKNLIECDFCGMRDGVCICGLVRAERRGKSGYWLWDFEFLRGLFLVF